MRIARLPVCLLIALNAGCASMVSRNAPAIGPGGEPVKTLVPNGTLQIGRTVGLSAENALLGAALYWAIDPLAPNWAVSQQTLSADRVRIALKRKRFASGGDGEAAQLFARHAERLARERGCSGYSILEYTEGIESTLPLAQRVAEGTVLLAR